MNYINRLSISGFKSIKEMKDLELRPLNVLIGANGAGKSNLVSFFELLREISANGINSHVATHGTADALLWNGAKCTKFISSSLHCRVRNAQTRYTFTLQPTVDGTLYLQDESIEAYDTEKFVWYDLTMNSKNVRSRWFEKRKQNDSILNVGYFAFPRGIKRIIGGGVSSHLRSCKVFQFSDTSLFAPIRGRCKYRDGFKLNGDGSNFVSVLNILKQHQQAEYSSILDTIRLVMGSFEDFVLEPYRQNPDFLDWRWKERGNSYEFRPHQLSDGTLRFMALVTLLKLPPGDMPSLVIIDEPELGLHPRAISVLADLLKIASVSTQIIVSTQSPAIVDQMEPEDIIVVDREEDQSVFHRLDKDKLNDWLTDYSLGELWQKNICGGNPG